MDIVPVSTTDWKGHCSTVVFFAGCPMNCVYCSNHAQLNDGKYVNITDIEDQITKASKFVDSVVFSGGEPMMHANALERLIDHARSLGLKTAVHTRLRGIYDVDDRTRADLAASFEEAIVDVLVSKCRDALEREGLQRLVVAGGVGANAKLRTRLQESTRRIDAQVFFPPLRLCTDNGAMIAFAAALKYTAAPAAAQSFPIFPRWDLAEAAAQSTPCR
jgi:N6-L-threonylcarbamoyladenine synthase